MTVTEVKHIHFANGRTEKYYFESLIRTNDPFQDYPPLCLFNPLTGYKQEGLDMKESVLRWLGEKGEEK